MPHQAVERRSSVFLNAGRNALSTTESKVVSPYFIAMNAFRELAAPRCSWSKWRQPSNVSVACAFMPLMVFDRLPSRSRVKQVL